MICAVHFLIIGIQHIYWRLVGMQDTAGEQLLAQRINLRLHIGPTDALNCASLSCRACRSKQFWGAKLCRVFAPSAESLVDESGRPPRP